MTQVGHVPAAGSMPPERPGVWEAALRTGDGGGCDVWAAANDAETRSASSTIMTCILASLAE
jgi:hypothetical protein